MHMNVCTLGHLHGCMSVPTKNKEFNDVGDEPQEEDAAAELPGAAFLLGTLFATGVLVSLHLLAVL